MSAPSEAACKLATSSSNEWWHQEEFRRTRVIPTLLLQGSGFVKTVQFKKPTYLGDPINIVKIFNEKEADEIVVLDITATKEGRGPNFEILADIASECFMPLTYGGGITSIDQIRQLTALGFEKICLNTSAIERPELVKAAADQFGSSAVVVSIDVKERRLRKRAVMTNCGRVRVAGCPVEIALRAQEYGAGELLLNSISRDGTMRGYDLELVRSVSDAVEIPVVACGGAATISDLGAAVRDGGASAVAAGSMFVFHGPHRAVLINMPTDVELAATLP